MPTLRCQRSVPIETTPRVLQLEGLFDVPPSDRSTVEWTAHLPLDEQDWGIGLIVGPSGCGKTTVARELFGDRIVDRFDWPADKCLLDAFPERMGIRDITELLSRVGFSSPPAWLRPFRVLSNGEQFRATLARALAESTGTVVIDEFTSVVDRTVARIGSAAVAKAVRERRARQPAEAGTPAASPATRFVAVSCHYDIIDWLDPDWVYEPATDAFHWRCERRGRPRITLQICRVGSAAWKPFRHHHYLSRSLHFAARCFLALFEERPAAFVAVLHFPHPVRSGWREHRAVCLPDFQGVGIGNALSEFVASVFRATGKPYRSTTSHPGMIRHRAASPFWKLIRTPSRTGAGYRRFYKNPELIPPTRLTAGFEYVGPARPADARAFRIV